MGTRSAELEVRLSCQATIRNTLPDARVASLTVGGMLISGRLQNGVQESQTNRAWEDVGRELSSGSTEDLDLYDFAGLDIGAGDGKDALGQPLAMEEIVTLMIKQTGGTGRLQIMPTVPSGGLTWVPTLTVANGGALREGGVFLMHQPAEAAFDVEDGVSHKLRLGASGGTAEYTIFVAGRSDDDDSSSSSSSLSSSSSKSSSSSSSQSSSSQSSSSSSSSSQSASSVSSSSSSTSSLSSSSSSSP